MKCVTLFAAAAAFVAAAAPAFAVEAPRQPGNQTQRVVMTCERDALTQAAFRAQHGSRPVFVTADQVVNAAGERWSAPRCMSAREQQRLTRMMNPRVSR